MSNIANQGFIIMGVSGCGKSTIAKRLSEKLGCPFIEGDEFHPAANVKKMSAGMALTDADRAPWLSLLANQAQVLEQTHSHWVLSCSALKPVYRDVFRAANLKLQFIYLQLSKEALQQRLTKREGHFMPATLLDSQLATLSFNDSEADIIHLPADQSVEHIIESLFSALRAKQPEPLK